jgi:hypothetical protein
MSGVECENCGAAVEVPTEGLELRCAFCGHAQPVPDAEARRRRLEEERREREEADVERRLKKVELEEAEQRLATARAEERRKKLAFFGSLPGRIVRGVLKVGLPIAIVAVVLHESGLLNAWIGDPGTQEFSGLRDRLVAGGYAPILTPEVTSIFMEGSARHPLALQPGYCYAFAAGAHRPIRSVTLVDPAAVAVAESSEQGPGRIVAFCPRSPGIHAAVVAMESNLSGRYTSQWFFRAALAAPAVVAPPPVRAIPLPAATIKAPAKKAKIHRAKRSPAGR